MSDPREFGDEFFTTTIALAACGALIPELTTRALQDIQEFIDDGLYRFFTAPHAEYFDEGKDYFPCDVDTTSVVISTQLALGFIEQKEAAYIADRILETANEDGIIQVYFDESRPRLDVAVCVNALYCLSMLGIVTGDVVENTKRYVAAHLMSGEWRNGGLHYPSPDTFLYLLSRLVAANREQWHEIDATLVAALVERVDSSSIPIERAMRVVACQRMGIRNRIDHDAMMASQLSDGGWPMNGLYIAVRNHRWFGSRELVTALSVEAMRWES